MNKTYLVALGAISAFAAISPAAAQETSLSGLYLGVLAGYDSVHLSADGEGGSKDGFDYGLVAGYDYDLGNALVGLEAEISDSSANVTETDLLVTGDSAKLTADRDIYIGARLGAKVAPRTLLYVKGGYTNARFSLSYTDGAETIADGENLSGYRLGAGVQYSLGRAAIRGEYRYSNYGNYEYDDIDTGLKTERHQVVVSLVANF